MMPRPFKTISPLAIALLFFPGWARAVKAAEAQLSPAPVLILLHESKACPASEGCATAREQEVQALRRRLSELGAAHLEYYPTVNMIRADIAPALMDIARAEPAVAAVFPVAEGHVPEVANRELEPGPALTTSPLFGRGAFSSVNVAPFFAPSSRIPPLQQAGTPGWQSPAGFPGGAQPNGAQQNGMLPPYGGGGAPGLFFGNSARGILADSAMNFGLGLVASRGGMGGMLGGLAGNLAIGFLSARSANCKVTVTAANASFPEPGGKGSLRVRAPRGCVWQASAAADWIHVSGAQGTGSGAVAYEIDALPSGVPSRSAPIIIESVQAPPMQGRTPLVVKQTRTP